MARLGLVPPLPTGYPSHKYRWEPPGREGWEPCLWAPTELLATLGLAQRLRSQEGSWSHDPGVGRARHTPAASRPTTCYRRLRQPQHKILEQLRNCGNDIFVVTEVLQTQKEVTVTWIYKQEGSGQFSLPGALSLQVCGMGWGGRRRCPQADPQPQHPAYPAPQPRAPS